MIRVNPENKDNSIYTMVKMNRGISYFTTLKQWSRCSGRFQERMGWRLDTTGVRLLKKYS